MLICSKRETRRCGAAPEGLMAAIPPGLSVTSMCTPSLGRQRACIRTFAWNKAFVNYTGALLFWQGDTGMHAFSKGVFLTLPAFKEMCYFTAWCQLVADTIWIHICNFRDFLSSDHDITRMNYLPHIRNHTRSLLPVQIPTSNFRLLRYIFSSAEGLLGLRIIMIGINKFKHAWRTPCFRLTYI